MGNKLFKLAGLDHISRRTNRRIVICDQGDSPHSKENYFDSLFGEWMVSKSPPSFPLNIREPSFDYHDWRSALANPHNVRIHGYFQNWKYIDNSFKQRLRFNTSILSKYPDIGNKVFIHVRGGDYVNHWLHDIKLDNYYSRAITEFPSDTQFVIFTNDVQYAQSRTWIGAIQHTFIHENELDSMLLMSKCAGCICPNSTFSWWGAFLNPNRKIVMPNKWFNDPSIYFDGYYFPGVIKCPV